MNVLRGVTKEIREWGGRAPIHGTVPALGKRGEPPLYRNRYELLPGQSATSQTLLLELRQLPVLAGPGHKTAEPTWRLRVKSDKWS